MNLANLVILVTLVITVNLVVLVNLDSLAVPVNWDGCGDPLRADAKKVEAE